MTEFYNCTNCSKSTPKSKSKVNKFCSNICQAAHRWERITKPKILNGQGRSAKSLKRFVFERDGDYCSECKIPSEWNGMPLTLQLDHVDGNSDNCNPHNLRLLCPNCHTQTETYGAKGAGNTMKKDTRRNRYFQNKR